MSFWDRLLNADWTVWFLIILLIFVLLWIFFGGGDYEYVGLSPMDPNVNSTKYVDDQIFSIIERGNYRADTVSGIDITPEIPSEISEIPCIPTPPIVPSSFIPSSVTETEGLTPINNAPPLGQIQPKPPKKCSNGERICREVLEEMYGKPFDCVRPDFLKNPETGRNLELDCYNDELKIALEYNGIQHYKWPNFTGQTKEQFISQLRRDKYKADICEKHGIYLIRVPYNVSHNGIKDYIKYYAPENYVERLKDEADPSRIYDNISEEDISFVDSFFEE